MIQIKKHIWLFLLLVLAVVTHWRWFFMNAYFGWGDSSFHLLFRENWLSLFSSPSMWSALFNEYGGVNISLSSFFAYLLPSTLVRFGFDPRWAVKLAILIPSPILALFSMYFLIRYFTRNNLAGFIGALVYTFNVHFLLTESGTTQAAVCVGLAPLILLFFAKTLDSKKLKYGLFTGILCFISTSYEARFFYITAHLLFIYLLFKLIVVYRATNLRQKLSLVLYATIPVITLTTLSLYWLLPHLFSGTLTTNEIFNRGLFGDKYLSLRQSLAMMGPWWTGGKGYANFVVQPIPAYFWLIPGYVILGIILNIKRKVTYYFLFIALLGIFLTKQSDVPFPGAYLWLFKHYPGFNAFREASKFSFVLSLGYGFLIGQIFAGLDSVFVKRGRLRLIKIILALIVSGIFLWNSKPLIDGSILSMFIPRHLPPAYTQVKNFLLTDPEYSRTLWIPAASGWVYYDLIHPKNSLHNSHFSKWGNIISVREDFIPLSNHSPAIDKINHQALDIFNQPYAENFFNLLSVKYIFVPRSETDIDTDMFRITGLVDREYLVKLLDSRSYLRRIEIGTPEITAYLNKSFKPHLYLSREVESIFTPAHAIPVSVVQISPTQYQITISRLSTSAFLNFSESYHPGWKLYLGRFNLFQTLLTGNNLFPDEFHYSNDATFNSFLLNADYIKAHFSPGTYRINSDGSLDFDLTLYFVPQTYVYLGLTITALITAAFVITVVLVRRKKKS